jgi:hypothetical protein
MFKREKRRDGMDAVENREILLLPEIETRPSSS